MATVTDLTAGPFLAASALLLAAGFGKIRNPSAVAPALRALGSPDSALTVRALGLGEVFLGGCALFSGHWTAAVALAAAYSIFAGALVLLLRRGHSEISCGCFGVVGSPIGRLHVVVNGVLAVVSIAAVFGPPRLQLLGDTDGAVAGVSFIVALCALVYGSYLLLTDFASLVRQIASGFSTPAASSASVAPASVARNYSLPVLDRTSNGAAPQIGDSSN